jgi:hypothetical protein
MPEEIKQPLTAEELKNLDKIVSQLIRLRSSMRDKNNCTIGVNNAIRTLCGLVEDNSQPLKLTT